MADVNIEELKRILRREVALLCRQEEHSWKMPLSRTLNEIRSKHWPAVFFGGTLRSLLISRLTRNLVGRPRDIDIVLGATTVEELQEEFGAWVSRRTRFGGLGLSRKGWQFDLWPVNETFYFKQIGLDEPEFADLPRTTFLNAEAIAVEVWPQPGKPRQIYSWDDQFFSGVLKRTLEVNQVNNPFPELSVVRAIIMANHLQWRIGAGLANYIAKNGPKISSSDLIDIQNHHYGVVRLPWPRFTLILDKVIKSVERDRASSVDLEFEKQLPLWPGFASSPIQTRVNLFARQRRSRDRNTGDTLPFFEP